MEQVFSDFLVKINWNESSNEVFKQDVNMKELHKISVQLKLNTKI